MTGNSDPSRRPLQYGRMPRWVLERLRGNADAVHLYIWLQARYGHPQNTERPTLDDLAAETGMSRRKVERALTACRRAQVINSTHRHDKRGYVTGADYQPVLIEPSEPPPFLTATNGSQDQNAISGSQDGAKSVPDCQNQPRLTAISGRARSLQISTDQIRDLAAVDLRGSKQQAAHPPTPAQQQHAPPARGKTGGASPPDPPKNDDIVQRFYDRWGKLYGARCDPRPSDRRFIEEMVSTYGRAEVLEVIDLFFASTDCTIIGPPEKKHPLGWLKLNAGKLLARPLRRASSWCDHEPQCRSATQHRDLILAEGRAQRALTETQRIGEVIETCRAAVGK